MRLLVLSDSHGKGALLDRIIRNEPEAKHIFFLGDVLSDIEDLAFEYTDRTFYSVAGNCDFFSGEKTTDSVSLFGKKILFTHGHLYGVNGGTGTLLKAAKNQNADIVLFGHTHASLISYEDGVYIVNPGSVALSRAMSDSYAVIDITDKGILPAIKKVSELNIK